MHKSTRLLGAGLALILGSLALTLQSFGQGGQRESGPQNKSTK